MKGWTDRDTLSEKPTAPTPISVEEQKARLRLDGLIGQVWCALHDLSEFRDHTALTEEENNLWFSVASHSSIRRILDQEMDATRAERTRRISAPKEKP